ncbi:MAG: hydroxyphenylacetyl-CoA thioesterase PaaI, partial [Micromonosporaceae bacterium]
RTAGISVDEVAPGRARASMTVNETMINGHRICHGGYVFLLADTAFAFACNTYGTPTVAQGCDIEFVRSARLGDRLVATASERGRYGRNGIYDVTVTCGDGVVAEFRGRSRTIPPRGTDRHAGPAPRPEDTGPAPLPDDASTEETS